MNRKRLYSLIDFAPGFCRQAKPSDRVAHLAGKKLRLSENSETKTLAGSVLRMRVRSRLLGVRER